MFFQSFTVFGADLGQVESYFERVHETLRPPASIAWFCPTCGDVWARREVRSERGEISKWQFYRRYCKACGKNRYQSFEFPAGSLLRSCDSKELDNLPEPVLKRELDILIDLYDTKFLNKEKQNEHNN